jgi:SEC-C motif
MGKKSRRDSWDTWSEAEDIQELWKRIQHTGRNDPCWCNSGQKYKRCHLNRSQEEPLRSYEYIKIMRKYFDAGYCLHPEANPATCVVPIVRTHTVSRSGSLNRIARDGHVYTFSSAQNVSDGDLISPRLIGVKKASTFTGFCKLHDNITFEPIERYAFLSMPQHAFLLGYRVLCHELYNKKANVEWVFPYQRQHLDRGKSLEDQMMIQFQIHNLNERNTIGLRDLEHYKAAYDKALVTANFSDIYYYVIRLSTTPEFLCAAPHMPDLDFAGRVLQNILDTSIIVDHLTFSLIATESGGAAVFSWYGKSDSAEQFVKSLDSFSDDELPHAIVRFTFEYFENVFVSPTWWEGLNDTEQQSLLRRQWSGLPSTGQTYDCLTDDGLRTVNWTISSRETNLLL